MNLTSTSFLNIISYHEVFSTCRSFHFEEDVLLHVTQSFLCRTVMLDYFWGATCTWTSRHDQELWVLTSFFHFMNVQWEQVLS